MQYTYLFFMPLKGFGGLEMQMAARASDALENGDKAIAVTISGTKSDDRVKELCVPAEHMEVKVKYFDIFTIRKLGKLFVKHGVDICVVSQSYHLSIAIAAKNLYSNKTAVIFYQQMQSGIKKKDFLHNKIYRNLDGSIVLTERMKRELTANTIVPEDKTAVVPCGIDIARFTQELDQDECRAEFNLPNDKYIFGYVARIDPHKAQITAIRAFAEANIQDTYLVFCGDINNAEYFHSLKEMIDEKNLKDKVKFLPFTKKIPELMKAFDCFIMPSRSETLGLVTIEAMAAGKPVIATSGGGVPEIIDHGIDGMLFPQEDIETLAKYMKQVHGDSVLSDDLGKAAIEKAKSKFDYKKQSNKFFDFCNAFYLRRNGKARSNENTNKKD
jgi:glycosyltransferase involved in cell wall biosynthesis